MNMGSLDTGVPQAMEQWRTSSGHYRNMVNEQYDLVGYGYSNCGGNYYTGMFTTAGGYRG
jgi:uncharacterized protein YkwD